MGTLVPLKLGFRQADFSLDYRIFQVDETVALAAIKPNRAITFKASANNPREITAVKTDECGRCIAEVDHIIEAARSEQECDKLTATKVELTANTSTG
jgi:bacterioferritin-associated ferredoxin